VLGGLVWWWRYEPRTHVPTRLAREYSRRYTLGQLRPGWNLRSVSRNMDRVSTLIHRVEVNPEIAGELLLMPRGKRRELVAGIACPPASDPIWERLTSAQDVLVELSTDRGSFETVACRARVF
jgi:hypothetical protein